MRASRSPRARLLALALAVTSALAFLSPATALTFPSETRKLLALKRELTERGLGYLLDTWVCDDTQCDPCGPTAGASDSWGAWHYVACRVLPKRERDAEASRPENAAVSAFDDGSLDTSPNRRKRKEKKETYYAVTNIHLSDLNIEGTFDSLLTFLCPLSHLRELDIDGGRMTGPLPEWLGDCFPKLTELDLSHNNLGGVLPTKPWALMSELLQVKLEDNRLTGLIPPELSYLPNLRVLWLDDNDFYGPIPPELGQRLTRLLSFNAEDNPKLCGPVPAVAVDWRWHLDNQQDQVRDWFAFCEKDPCGVFVLGGTQVGTACPGMYAEASPSSRGESFGCGKAFDQCGGTVAARLATRSEWNSVSSEKLDDTNSIVVDVPFNGSKCCRRGNYCAEIPVTSPCKNGSNACAFLQCTPIDGAKVPPKTKVPPEVIQEWRTEINQGKDAQNIVCAPAFAQCGGTVGWTGPTCCEGNAPCVRTNEYFAQCDPSECAAFGKQCGGEFVGNSDTAGNPDCCRAGSECVIRTAGYHECVPFSKLEPISLLSDSFARVSQTGKLKRADAANGDNFWKAERKGECVSVHEQCGGFVGDDESKPYVTATCCGARTQCVRKNKWYAACSVCADTYGQCGGAEFAAGGSCCAEAEDTCVEVDEYYSQCLPS